MNPELVKSLVQVIQSLPSDDYAYLQEELILRNIKKTEGVCGGRACIRNSRIPVWTIISFQNQGATDEELLRNFPILTPFDLLAVRSYYHTHQSEIDRAIAANAEE